LKKMKDVSPFLHPVDPVALNCPHYPSIVKHPMDFSTVGRKLTASNASKPSPNLVNPRYYNAEDFIADVRLIFTNCGLFNGPDHPITATGKRVEAVFDKQVKQMPPPEEVRCITCLRVVELVLMPCRQVDNDALSFEQKKDLSDTIGKLEGAKMEKVVQVTHERVPKIRDSTEEIELEIDELPATVLTKLYNFV
ncbi:Bromodomain-containing protein, partial [Fomitopsis serialis]|uniref:Bromodomain-containing protein n=1 Tax=Fomitopsis serialis TaxID=139415 RepID=UPI002008B0A4